MSSEGFDVATSSYSSDYGSAPRKESQTLGNLVLPFSRDELCRYVDARLAGLARKSKEFIIRTARMVWYSTNGAISQASMERFRSTTLARYSSNVGYSKTLGFAKAYLLYLTKVRLDSRYSMFAVFLERSKAVKERKAITPRICTTEDIENVLEHIKRAEQKGAISTARARQYKAFVLFSVYTGQRPIATTNCLTIGQFKEALKNDPPVLHVTAQQDKIRMEHYVPLHPAVIRSAKPLFEGKKDAEALFEYNGFRKWLARTRIPMRRFKGKFMVSDARKFAEQHGDVIGWDQSNRAYILTHGVSGVDWSHYKHPLPEHVYDVYMRCWGDVQF